MNEATSDFPETTVETDTAPASPATRPSVIRTRLIPALAILLVAALVGLLAWSLFAPDRARLGTQGRVNSFGALITEDGREAPTFTLTDFAGEEFDLAAQRGKIVVLNFWASWCPPCREETPLLQTASTTLPDDVQLIGVAVWDDESDARGFLEDYGVTYRNARDANGDVAIDYGLSGVPETFVIDAEGKIVARLPGPITSVDQLQEMVAVAR